MGAVPVHPRTLLGALAPGAKLDRYEILARLAAGGMATVYVARVQGVAGFERLVAIKVLHSNLAHEDEFIRMFLDEARLAASVRHPNVVPTIDVSDSKEAGYGYFIVMEYIEGDHLGALLSAAHKADEKLPLPISLRIVADALGGLGAAHDLCDDTGKSLQLVHRDVSPHNIMVGRDGVVRLTDFGVAKAEDRLTHTRDGQVKGKLAYMAPEQAVSGKTDARSDLFSVGVILWECVTGQRLFRAETTASTLHKLMHEPIPAPSSSDPQLALLDALLAKALARNPADRFQSAEEFAQAIEELAPAVGGLASLRSVARSVKQHAAAKLKREKKLIDDAMRALRPVDAPEPAPQASDEVTSPSGTEVSVSSASLSASKVSGVFSHDTLPGARTIPARRGAEVVVASPAVSSQIVETVSADARAAMTRRLTTTDAPTWRAPAPTSPLLAAEEQQPPQSPSLASPRPARRFRAAFLVVPAVLIVGGYFLARIGDPSAARQKATSLTSSATGSTQPQVPTVQAPTAAAPQLPVAELTGAASVRPTAATSTRLAESATTPSEPEASRANPEPARSERAVRAGTRRDDVPAARTVSRRTRRDVSTKPQRRDVSSDVMPNPYHD